MTSTESMPKLFNHQKIAIEKAISQKNFALFFDIGTGKTRTAIEILKRKYNGNVKKTLIFCPPIVITNWLKEFQKFSDINASSITLLKGTGKQRLKQFQDKAFGADGLCLVTQPHIFVTNFQSLLMKDLFLFFQKWNADYLIIDESHRMKNSSGKMAKNLEMLANPRPRGVIPAPYKLILSGSPVLNSPMDLFQQFKILDGGETFGISFYKFRSDYFSDRNAWMHGRSFRHFPKWELKNKDLDGVDGEVKIHYKISEKSMSIKKSQCLDLPPLIREKIFVEMSLDQERHYEEMRRDFVTYVESGACVAELVITKGLRLMQIVSGFMGLENGKIKEFLNTPREEMLEELLIEHSKKHKIIIWAVWVQNYETIRRVCKKLNISFVECHGGTSQKKKDEAVYEFNEKDVRVFIGNPASLGVGINLVSSALSIYYSRNFTLENDIQSEGRNYRSGSEIHEKIVRLDIVTLNTIDEIVLESLANKQKVGDKILRKNLKNI